MVLRTFSKWAGLAGLRVGYGAFPDWLLPALWKAKQPYNVNVAASTAALASLEDQEYLAGNVARLRSERERLYQGLQRISCLRPFPSQANFILCQVLPPFTAASSNPAWPNAASWCGAMTHPLLNNFIRISIGLPEHSDSLLAALAKLAEERSRP